MHTHEGKSDGKQELPAGPPLSKRTLSPPGRIEANNAEAWARGAAYRRIPTQPRQVGYSYIAHLCHNDAHVVFPTTLQCCLH